MSINWLDNELALLHKQDLFRHRTVRTSSIGNRVVIDGKSYLNFASNDYLGLAGDPTFTPSLNEALEQFGWGSGASPLVVGRHEVHSILEKTLAEFLNTEAAILFPTGFAANAGTIPALVGKNDLVFSDAKNHASIIDGCRLSGARVVIFNHSDIADLATKIEKEVATTPKPSRRLIVTDSLFSMDGDFANLPELVRLSNENQAMLMVDEAHAFGVIGKSGAGVCEQQGVLGDVPVRVGTLSKSLGSHGGFVAGSKQLISYLSHRARSYVFSTAAPAANAAAALCALQVIKDQPERRAIVLSHAGRLREALNQSGWRVSSSPGSHIVAVVVGEAAKAVEIARHFREAGIWVACIRPPSVPVGESLLRISLSSAHTEEMVDQLLEKFSALSGV